MSFLKSMTGIGVSQQQVGELQVDIIIKSYNSKGFDMVSRVPDFLSAQEMVFRKKIQERGVRGKFNLSIFVSQKPDLETISPKKIKKIDEAWHSIETQLGKERAKEIQQVLLAFKSEIFRTENNTEDQEKTKKTILELVEKALKNLETFRIQEGENLEKDICFQLQVIENSVGQIEAEATRSVEVIRQKINTLISETISDSEKIDTNRLEQEIVYYVNKIDIREEVIRLKSHLNLFETKLKSDDQEKGKMLGFVVQEILREINTIGSKVSEKTIQNTVVEMKNAQDRLKEQLLNIL